MHRLWRRIRLPFAIGVMLVCTLAMARLFSGPEDTWIKNEHGEWVAHGHPSGPPPAHDYQEPPTSFLIPLAFLVAFAVPLFFLRTHRLHDRLTYETTSRDVKLYGYLSTSLFLFGILTGVGLMLVISLADDNGDLRMLEFFIIGSVAGLAGLCLLFGMLFYVLKRTSIDLYQLKKSQREILEMLENHSQSHSE